VSSKPWPRLLPGEPTAARRLRFAVVCMFTLCSLALGTMAVLLCLRGEAALAGWCLLACVGLDGIDGALARRLGVSSPFGAQLDSVADMGSFGVATAVVGYTYLTGQVATVPAAVVCVLVVSCAAIRLARFNVAAHDDADFHGLPTAMVAAVVGLTVLIDPPIAAAVELAGLFALALAMVSGLPYPSMRRLVQLPLWLWTLVLSAAAVQPRFMFPVAAIAYLCSGPVIWARRHHRSRDAVLAAALVLLLGGLPLGVTGARAAGPNPVVLIHGLNSESRKWAPYVGADGFLATIGRQGFAVGDGQAPGVINAGNELEALKTTNTIAENAAQLRTYIAGVKEITGAGRVDIVAHSMGGLIARYYIDRLMPERDVDRLIMLGTPNGGSSCAALPARLGVSSPATNELRPEYVREIFNKQINDRKGTAFYALAGDALNQSLASPCAGTPSDLVVGVDSVEAVGITARRLPLLHNDLKENRQVFDEFVAPALTSKISAATTESGTAAPAGELRQTVALAAGHVKAGDAVEQTLNIDDVAVATFAIYDPTRSLAVSVRGASGDTIDLTAADNGLIRIDDPETLLYLGYGFTNPSPGPWRVTLRATGSTPASGADFAVSAQVEGGARLDAEISELVPAVGEDVDLSAAFEQTGIPVVVRTATVLIQAPDGRRETVTLSGGDIEAAGTWRPAQPGLHSIDVVVTGMTADERPVERTGFLAAEVREPEPDRSLLSVVLVAAAVVVALVLAGIVYLIVRTLRKARRRRGEGTEQ
jgi:CDP-diacylglycerol--serine O-phosphatidyltransferase